MLIESVAQLEQMIANAPKDALIGIDTEFIRRTTYAPELALIQIAIDDEVYVIDPLKIESLSLLKDFLSQNMCILHDAQQDLEIFKAMGVPLNFHFDTQIAGLFLGYDLPPPYKTLVYDYCGATISKHLQQSNWLKRPLSQKMLNYAMKDVTYLVKIFYSQLDKLNQKGYLTYLKHELDAVHEALTFDAIVMRIFSRLCFQVESFERAANLYKIIHQRELIAKRTNIRRSEIGEDAELVAAAHDYNTSELAQKLGELELASTPENLKSRYEFLSAFSKVDWISRRNEIQMLQEQIACVSKDTGISREIIGTMRDIKHAIFDYSTSIFNTTWRKDLGLRLNC